MQYEERDSVAVSVGKTIATMVRVGELPNGEPYHLPVVSISGKTDGPTLVVHAGMHGDEVLGAACVRSALASIDAGQLRGTLLAVPVANMPGMATRTRRNVIELYPGPHDMNRIYPGAADGLMSERVANYMVDHIVTRADFLIDLHNASVGGWWEPYATVPARDDSADEQFHTASDELARAFGTGLIVSGNKYHGSLVDAAVSVGVPSTMVEFGVANVIRPEEVAFGARGVLNALRSLDMLDGAPELPDEQVTLSTLHRVKSNRGGFMTRFVDVGQDVQQGDKLAEVEDLGGTVLEVLSAPVAGRVCRISTMGVVGTGDIIAYVGT